PVASARPSNGDGRRRDQKQLEPLPWGMLKIDLERSMEHRRFLAHPEAHHPFAGGNLLGRIGSHPANAGLIDGAYDNIETDAALRPLFTRDLNNEGEAHRQASGFSPAALLQSPPIMGQNNGHDVNEKITRWPRAP